MHPRRLALILTALVVAASPAAAEAATIDAGSLRAQTASDPWRLDFVDGAGRSVLREAARRDLGPSGTLGFRTAAGWFHATRVVSERRDGRAYVATLATSDPLGRRLSVRIERDAEGVIRLRAGVEGPAAAVTATGIGFDARDGERYLGFGERSNAVDQRGNAVENYVAEGPYQPEERPIISAFVPPPGYHPRDDATYFPIPWLLSTAGYGVLVDNAEASWFRLGSERADSWSLEAQATTLGLRVFAGPRPASVLRRFTARVGRQPPASPYWLGPWYQPRRDDERGELERFLRGNVPLTLAQTYTHYLPCGDHEGAEADQRARATRFHDAGLAVTTYFNPMVCEGYGEVFDEAASRGALTKNALGQPYLYRYTGSSVFLVGQFDFTSGAARDIYARLLREALGHGYDGWMEDFGEYTPTDARSSDGTPGPAMHNLYPRLYHCAAYGAVRSRRLPIARFIRSGWTGVAPCAQIVWNGDPTTDWGFDGLQSALRNGLTMGLSGISRWGSDIGGFFALGSRRLTPELLIRWIELGAVSGVMRSQANGFALPSKPRPQLSDPELLPHWRRWARLRTRLYPYIAAADARYRRDGMPVMRHLALGFPGDARASRRDEEFLFGPDILAAPVMEPGKRTRSLYLPGGRWVDLWRVARFAGANGRLALGRGHTVAGGREVTVAAPLHQLPLFVRAGSVLPFLPREVDTLSPYGGGRRQLRLADRSRRLDLLAFPRGRRRGWIGPGERYLSSERRGRWTLTLRGVKRRRYRLYASLGTLRRPFRPCRIYARGKRVRRRAWRYSRRRRTLRVSFRMRSGRLVVRRCRRR
jgi:alpha-glucosidase (family GH31 glycosyl hydrolase)